METVFEIKGFGQSVNKRNYGNSLKLEQSSIDVHLLKVVDEAGSASERSHEVIELVCQIICLSHKRGRVGRAKEVGIDEAA